ncbi:hypothetical protein EX895_001310 [Sporisorium graminicola]|uniref:AB hydrolase-1 domain-containing protein n=1 Tax=Sporisorium graminicola TaxID=280036 RepID=A0A4U7KXJ1_9BASI|nr:hypothetical protein EX895_001310 [Sporisorium graminicola]TKY89525.1 hypothetical protein EX895_001310 [Sporisorium graminicola]
MATAASTSAFDREDVQFPSGGELCAAWLYRPTGAPLQKASSSSKPRLYPVVVMAHGLGGIKEMGLDRYASCFAELGIVCLVFDYRHLGESGGTPRQLIDIQRQLDDYVAAIDYAAQLEFVDKQRIGVFGSSFSGGHVIEVAARDKRVTAVVSQCPFTNGFHSARCAGILPMFQLLGLAIRDVLFTRKDEIVSIKLAGKPGETAMMNSHDAMTLYDLVPPHLESEYKDYIAARLVLHIGFYCPGWKTSKVHCPILFAICGKDSVCPSAPTLSYAKKAPKATIMHYKDTGHFNIYTGANFDMATKDYTKFLRSNL